MSRSVSCNLGSRQDHSESNGLREVLLQFLGSRNFEKEDELFN